MPVFFLRIHSLCLGDNPRNGLWIDTSLNVVFSHHNVTCITSPDHPSVSKLVPKPHFSKHSLHEPLERINPVFIRLLTSCPGKIHFMSTTVGTDNQSFSGPKGNLCIWKLCIPHWQKTQCIYRCCVFLLHSHSHVTINIRLRMNQATDESVTLHFAAHVPCISYIS